MNIEEGDWVRFQQNGKLVIGVVFYSYKDYFQHTIYITDLGNVTDTNVLEVRKKAS